MRLPDITYGGEVRPLAKEDPNIAAKKAQVEIDLSKAQLGADLGVAQAKGQADLSVAQSTGQAGLYVAKAKGQADIKLADDIGAANIRLAREMRQVDQDKAWSKAKIATDAFAHGVDMNAMTRNTMAQVVSSLAQTAISQASRWYEADQESSAAKGSAVYSAKMGALTADLASSKTIDLNKYPNIDFSSIPKNMIYEGTDEVTGKKVRSAPNHLAAPLIYADAEQKIREEAAKGIDSRLARAKFDNSIAQDQERNALTLLTANKKHEHEFLQGQYQTAIDTTVAQGDFAKAISMIDSAEARGVYSSEQAAGKRHKVASDVKYVNYMKAIDGTNDLAELSRIQASTVDLPKEDQTLVRSAVAKKEAQIERIAEKKRVEAERALVGQRSIMASEIAIAAGGLKNPEAGRQAVIKAFFNTDPKHVDDYVRSWESRYSSINTQIHQQKEAVQAAWYKDPTQPIPAEFDGKNLVEAQKYQAKVVSGAPLETDMQTFVKLERLAGTDPNAFKNQNLDLFRGALDDSAMKHFSGMQSKMISGEQKGESIQSAHAVFDNAAKQVFGPKYASSKSDSKKADNIFQAYTMEIEQAIEAKGKQLTTSEMQAVANDVFRTKVQSMSSSWYSSALHPTEVKLSDPDVNKYIPQISNMLKAGKQQVTPQNIIKEYTFRLQHGTLKELDY